MDKFGVALSSGQLSVPRLLPKLPAGAESHADTRPARSMCACPTPWPESVRVPPSAILSIDASGLVLDPLDPDSTRVPARGPLLAGVWCRQSSLALRSRLDG